MFVDDADAIYVKLHDTIMRNNVKKCKHLIESMEIDLNKQFRLHKKVSPEFSRFYLSMLSYSAGRALNCDWFGNSFISNV